MDAETYELQFHRWLFLMDTVNVLRLQGEITNELEEKMIDTLLFFKPNQDDVTATNDENATSGCKG